MKRPPLYFRSVTKAYDNEGNITVRTKTSDSTSVEYAWDHRNRLTTVTFKDDVGATIKTVDYAYDHVNRMFSRVLDDTTDTRTIFIPNGQNETTLQFEDDNAGSVEAADLTRRRLWQSNKVDRCLVEEIIGDDVYYPLGDHLNTVRDVVSFDSGFTTLEKHIDYTAFGEVESDSAPSLVIYSGFTGKYFDPTTFLNNHWNRWYDSSIGRWLSTDPISFDGGDGNLYRYASNAVIYSNDGTGLVVYDNYKGQGVHIDKSYRFTNPMNNKLAGLYAEATGPGFSHYDGYIDLIGDYFYSVFDDAHVVSVQDYGLTMYVYNYGVSEHESLIYGSGYCRVDWMFNAYNVGLVHPKESPVWGDFEHDFGPVESTNSVLYQHMKSAGKDDLDFMTILILRHEYLHYNIFRIAHFTMINSIRLTVGTSLVGVKESEVEQYKNDMKQSLADFNTKVDEIQEAVHEDENYFADPFSMEAAKLYLRALFIGFDTKGWD